MHAPKTTRSKLSMIQNSPIVSKVPFFINAVKYSLLLTIRLLGNWVCFMPAPPETLEFKPVSCLYTEGDNAMNCFA